MPIDIDSEELIPLRKACEHIPGRPHISCVYRWMSRKSGPLETVLVGGRRWTSVEAIERFIAACNPSQRSTPAVVSKRRKAQIAAAGAELDRAGIR